MGSPVYVYYTPENNGDASCMFIYDATSEQTHLDMYGVTEQNGVKIGHVTNSGDAFWPKDAPCMQEDIHHFKVENKKLVFCPIKGRKNFVNKLRDERNKKLAELDVEFTRNLEEGKDNTATIKKKKILRDMPTHGIWDKCKTLDDFKKVTILDILSNTTQ